MSNLEPLVQIGEWHYQVLHGHLWPAGSAMDPEQMVRLEPRLHSLLNFFLLHPGELLSKDTLMEKVWPVNEGTDAAVMRAIGALRKVLCDDVRAPRYIETVSKKGYRWLADIHPLTSLNLPQPLLANTSALSAPENLTPIPWRFIVLTALAVLISCASVAYMVTRYSPAPFIKLPDIVTPVSALSGQEYWPLLNEAETHVIYQHSASSTDTFGWARQSLETQKAEFAPEQYQQLSAPLWLAAERILFRAITGNAQCYFYQQQIVPFFGAPERLWRCQQMVVQGTARWKQQLLWLDGALEQPLYQLWGDTAEGKPELIYTFDNTWRNIEHIVVQDNTLYLLAQDTFSGSQLLALDLTNKKLTVLTRFPFVYEQLAIWDEQHLLLKEPQQLVLYNLNSGAVLGLGPLTGELSQARRYTGQVLAKQSLGYTTDILAVKSKSQELSLTPWQVSNRSENFPAQYQQKTAFVSERAGHNQVWLEEGSSSRQLTQLEPGQRIQQLFWHQQNLMAVINSELFIINKYGELMPYPIMPAVMGRYQSCEQQLYWTQRSEDGWSLQTNQDGQVRTLYNDVVDVRCGPADSLVLQFARNNTLALYQHGNVTALPVQIDWRQANPEHWFADPTGIYWLDKNSSTIKIWFWGEAQINSLAWKEQPWPVGIFSNGAGLGYIVSPRPIDTDVVWLQNRS